MRRRLLILPFAHIVLGLSLLVGCFYIPTGERLVKNDHDIRAVVGDEKSNLPIRVNFTTRKQILALLGRQMNAYVPTTNAYLTSPAVSTRRMTPDVEQRDLEYQFKTVPGYWFIPMCFMVPEDLRTYTVTFHFDGKDILRSYSVTHFEIMGSSRNHDTQPLSETGKNFLQGTGGGSIDADK